MGSLAYHPREAETLTLTSYSVLADGHLVVPLELTSCSSTPRR